MSCIVLIGMPGAGKSTLGVQLAKETARDFVDTDVAIQLREKKTLQAIIVESGYLKLRDIEEQVLLDLNVSHHVIATGGSAVYSERGMAKLKTLGPVIFLDVKLDELRRRINNYDDRGIARRANQSFEDLYNERVALYNKYADIVIDCAQKSQGLLLRELHEKIDQC